MMGKEVESIHNSTSMIHVAFPHQMLDFDARMALLHAVNALELLVEARSQAMTLKDPEVNDEGETVDLQGDLIDAYDRLVDGARKDLAACVETLKQANE